MQTYSCSCGNAKAYGSMGPDRCCGCSKCGTKLMPINWVVAHPGFKDPPEPHDFSYKEKVETDEGIKELTRCRWCHQTKKRIEEEE